MAFMFYGNIVTFLWPSMSDRIPVFSGVTSFPVTTSDSGGKCNVALAWPGISTPKLVSSATQLAVGLKGQPMFISLCLDSSLEYGSVLKARHLLCQM